MSRTGIVLWCVLFLCGGWCTPGMATTFYVATTGSGTGCSSNIQAPTNDPAGCISHLVAGDLLYFRGGTYAVNILNPPSGTALQPITIAGYPGETVILHAPGSDRIIEGGSGTQYLIFDNFVLNGSDVLHNVIKMNAGASHITIKNSEVKGSPDSGILIIEGAPSHSFINLNVHNNGTTNLDHGFYLSSDHNLVQGCDIHDNAGMGIQVFDSLGQAASHDNLVIGNRIHHNTQAGGPTSEIVTGSGDNNIFYNNLVYGGPTEGFFISNGGNNQQIYNNTIFGEGKDCIFVNNQSATVQNNICYQNNPDAVTGSGATADHNLLGTNPQFVNQAGADFHLSPGSPALGAGVAISVVKTDFDGNTRPNPPSIGAYDVANVVAQPTAMLNANPMTITAGNPSTLTWSSTNATSCSSNDFTTNGANSGSVTVSPSATKTYSVTCTGGSGTTPATASATVTVTAGKTSGSVNVSPTATTTYSVTCTGAGGSATANATVTVSSPPPPGGLPAPTNLRITNAK